MKKSIESLKLSLKKQTLVQLDKQSMHHLKGGKTDGATASTTAECVRTHKTRP
jgi:natural product precursor